jgi:hypothetical protein
VRSLGAMVMRFEGRAAVEQPLSHFASRRGGSQSRCNCKLASGRAIGGGRWECVVGGRGVGDRPVCAGTAAAHLPS